MAAKVAAGREPGPIHRSDIKKALQPQPLPLHRLREDHRGGQARRPVPAGRDDPRGVRPDPDGPKIGVSHPRPSSMLKACGVAQFTADIVVPGALELVAVRSPHPHAHGARRRHSAAEKMPGSWACMTAKDVKGTNRLKYIVADRPDPVRGQGPADRRPGGRGGRPHPRPGGGGRGGRQGGVRAAARPRHVREGHGGRRGPDPRRPAQRLLPAAGVEGRPGRGLRGVRGRGRSPLRHADQPPGAARAGAVRRLPGGRGRRRPAGGHRAEHQYPQAPANAAGSHRLGEHALRGGVLRRQVRHQAGHHLRGHRGRGGAALRPAGALHPQSGGGHADDLQAPRLRHAGEARAPTPRATSPPTRITSWSTTARTSPTAT